MPTLRSVSDPVQRDGYLQLLARRSGVDERVLLEKLHQREEPAGRGRGTEGAHAGGRINLDAVLASPDALDPSAVARTLEPAEATLLRLVLVRPDLQAQLRERLAPQDLITTPARELWRVLVADREADAAGEFHRDRFLEALDPTLEALARTLYAGGDPEPADTDLAIRQCLLALQRRRLAETLDFKRAELSEAEAAGDHAVRDALQAEIRELQGQRVALDRAGTTTTLLTRHRTADRTTAATGGTR